ncbi:MAG TPA: CYTH domain-containing protein [Stellaceae bacterium]|nr:CYTH domain-containing protein [Stellaceae bacterium]
MANEIERKFLVDMKRWRPSAAGMLYRQGYLSSAKERVVRVRIAGTQAYLTVKGPTVGITRSEFEYVIPLADATAMLDSLCDGPQIEKTRHREDFAGRVWEVDVFHGDNEGLVIAEIELASVTEDFERPPWAGREVSDDPRYYNNNLAANPYRNWRR